MRALYTLTVLSLLLLATEAAPPNTMKIFDIFLHSPWEDWGWSATIDTATADGGDTVVEAIISNDNGFYLHSSSPVTTANWYGLTLNYMAEDNSDTIPIYVVELYNSHGTNPPTWSAIFTPAAFDTWETVTLKFADFVGGSAVPATIEGFSIKLFYDDNELPMPNPTTTKFKYISIYETQWDSYVPESYNAPASAPGALIYDRNNGGLKSCWSDWSNAWADDYEITDLAYGAWIVMGGYEGLYFHGENTFDANAMGTFSYSVKAEQPGKRAYNPDEYKIVFFDTSDPPKPIGDGYIVRDTGNYNDWNSKTHDMKIFGIPLDTQISGVAFMGTARGSGTVYHFDLITLGTPPGVAADCSGLESDPIIKGFNGEVYDFKGVPKRIFNILSLPDLQVNSFFISGLNPGETYSGAIGIKQGDASFISFDLWGAHLHVPNGTVTPGVLRPAIKELRYPLKDFELPNGGVVSRPTPGRIRVEFPLYTIAARRIFEIHNFDEITYIDIAITLRIGNLQPGQIHGALGQTYHRTKAVNGTFEGTWEDYAAEEGTMDLFTDNFPQKFYRYAPHSSISYVAGEASQSGGAVGEESEDISDN